MGQLNSKQDDRANLLAPYDESEAKCDYGTILTHKISKQTYLLKELNIPDHQEYNKSLALFQAKKDVVRENVLNLIELENQSKSLFCSEVFRISLLYEFTQITLAEEVEARLPQLRYFQEQDLWSIIQSCLFGLAEIGQNIILQPNRVYIMSDGLVKIIDPDIISGNSWFMLDENIYYSPERFQNFSNLNKINTSEGQAMFSLGATLLNAAILESCFDCYEHKTHRFNYGILSHNISKLEELYSEDFKTVVCGLLEMDPAKRMTMAQIQDIVLKLTNQDSDQPYQEQQQPENYESQEPSYREQKITTNNPLRDCGNYLPEKDTCIPNLPATLKVKNVQVINSMQQVAHNYKYSRVQHRVQHSRVVRQEQHPMDSRLESVRSKNHFEKSVHFQISSTKEYTSLYKTQRDRDQDLFTDPKLMEQIRRDVSQITARRSLLPTSTTTNSNSGLVSHQERTLPLGRRQPEPTKSEVHYEQDGKVYEGRISNGVKQGYGKLSYPEGPFYLGNFQNDKMHGKGALYYQQGKPAYNGQWNQDQFHGQGTLYNQNPLEQEEPFDFTDFNMVEDFWTKYEGEFICDNKQGFGKLFLSNGQRFQGFFERDYINGQGTFFDKFGEKYQGRWDNNILEERFSKR